MIRIKIKMRDDEIKKRGELGKLRVKLITFSLTRDLQHGH